jgi:hypothetical protein
VRIVALPAMNVTLVAEATGTSLIYSFPYRRGEFRVYPKLLPTAAGKSVVEGASFILGKVHREFFCY